MPVLFYREFFTHADRHHYPYVLAAYALFLLFIFYKGFRLKLRVADLVESAALKCGLARITGRGKPPARTSESEPAAASTAQPETTVAITSVSPQPIVGTTP